MTIGNEAEESGPETGLVIDPRETGFHRLDLAELFGNTSPVILEIGSGKGRFLISTALERPEVNVIGIEKSLHYHRLIHERVRKRHLTNIRLVLVLRDMIPDVSIAEVHIYFSRSLAAKAGAEAPDHPPRSTGRDPTRARAGRPGHLRHGSPVVLRRGRATHRSRLPRRTPCPGRL